MSDEELLALAKEVRVAWSALVAVGEEDDALSERHERERKALRAARSSAYDHWDSLRRKLAEPE